MHLHLDAWAYVGVYLWCVFPQAHLCLRLPCHGSSSLLLQVPAGAWDCCPVCRTRVTAHVVASSYDTFTWIVITRVPLALAVLPQYPKHPSVGFVTRR